MIFNGIFSLSIWGYLVLTLILTHVTIVAVTIFLHRHQAHRAVELSSGLSHFFRFWLWLTTGMVTREWVAIHRKHHAKCESEDDPHSPRIRGLSTVLWKGSELYREEAKNDETLDRYGRGTPEDWIERRIYQAHNYIGIGILATLLVLMFGAAGLAIWAIQMIWIPFWAAGVINGIGHFWGYRNFELPNSSTNIVPWGILIGGEELHNNHHAYSSSAKLSNRWWEFDLGWLYIRLFSLLGLAQVKRVAPRRKLSKHPVQLDSDIIKVLTVNRLQLLADYGRRVLRPVFQDEIRSAKRPWRRLYRYARRLARRDVTLLSNEERVRLAQTLEHSKALQTVYQFKIRLQEIWEQNTTSQENRLESLSQWCRQAESSGIQALQDFALLIRRYQPITAH